MKEELCGNLLVRTFHVLTQKMANFLYNFIIISPNRLLVMTYC